MTWNTTAVDRFLKTVKTARDYNSKEVRLSTADAEQIAISLATVLNQERELTQMVMQLQQRLLNSQSSQPSEISLNGGHF
jgi:hypothetical protein